MSSSERESTLNSEVENWLTDIGLSQYIQNFKEEGFEDLDTIAWTFSNDTPETKEILTKMGVKKIGHQQKILHKARILKQSLDEKEKKKLVRTTENEIVEINVGGKYFATSIQTLQNENSMLSAMFSGKYGLKRDQHGRYFIDRDGKHFRHILNYLRDNTLPPFSPNYKPDKYHELAQEAQFYQIQGLIDRLQQKFPKWKFTESSSTIVISNDGYVAESRSDSGDYYIARCSEHCFTVTPQTKEYFEVQTHIPENSIVAIGLGNEKMDPSKVQNSGWSKENCGIGLYIYGGAIYRRGKVVEKLNLNKEDTNFGWLLQGFKIQFYSYNKAIGKPVSLDDDVYKTTQLYPVVILAKGAKVTITNDTLE